MMRGELGEELENQWDHFLEVNPGYKSAWCCACLFSTSIKVRWAFDKNGLDFSIVWLSKTFQNIGVRLNVWVAPVVGEGVPVVWKVRRISWHTVRNLGGDKVKVEVELQVYVEAKVEEEELCEY